MVDVEIGKMKYDLGDIELTVCKILQLVSYEPITISVKEYDTNKYCLSLVSYVYEESKCDIMFEHDNVCSHLIMLIEDLIKTKSLAQVERLCCDIKVSDVTYAGYEYVHYNK